MPEHAERFGHARDAKGGGAHLDAAPRGAEVERNADHANGGHDTCREKVVRTNPTVTKRNERVMNRPFDPSTVRS
jgi:hypothetical protein